MTSSRCMPTSSDAISPARPPARPGPIPGGGSRSSASRKIPGGSSTWRPKSMKREKIGSLFTVVAAVVVGDPCKLIADGRDPRPPIEYGEYVRQKSGPRLLPGEPGWEDARDPRDPVLLRGRGGEGLDVFAIPTVENCDGWVHVH